MKVLLIWSSNIIYIVQIAIDNVKRAFIFGDLAHQWVDGGNDCTPVWMKFPHGSAYRAFCGPKYYVLFCGINYPYLFHNDKLRPLDQLDRVNVIKMACSANFIVCACSDGKLMIIRESEMENFTIESTVVDYMNNLHITHISVSNEDIFLLADSIGSEATLSALPEYVPFDQPINVVLSHIENIPKDSNPHFLRIDQRIDSLNL